MHLVHSSEVLHNLQHQCYVFMYQALLPHLVDSQRGRSHTVFQVHYMAVWDAIGGRLSMLYVPCRH